MASAEEVYQRVTQPEKVLLRPGTYVGSTEYCERTVRGLERAHAMR